VWDFFASPGLFFGVRVYWGEGEGMKKENTPLVFRAYGLAVSVVWAGSLIAQAPSPLVYLQTIPVPGWTNSGTTQANLDIFTFNPYTKVLYVADRTNHAVTAVDTIENSVAGVLPIPGGGNTNGVLVALDLQKLVVTDGKNNVFVYDLRVPGTAPEAYALPGVGGNTDALDYDPLNHTAYVINGTAPYYMSGIDLANHKIASQLRLPYSPELMRFNPNDGLIYQAITDGDNAGKNKGLYVYDPVANTITAKVITADCTPHGVEIDPISNVLLLGCSPGGQTLIDLRKGSIIQTFANQTGTDLTAFNPNTRNFYTGAGSNNIASTPCPKDSSNNFPVVGVYNAASAGQVSQVGLQCTGRSAKGPGVDPFDNFVYVGTRQYPVDPASPNTGQNGLLVYWDPAARLDATPGKSAAVSSLDGKTSLGTLQFSTVQRRGLRATGLLTGAPGGTALVVIPTTVGMESVTCYFNADSSDFCDGPLLGAPLIGAPVLLGVNGAPAGKGTIQ
jgi:hypothetical protein